MSGPRLLLTRPRPDSLALAHRLKAHGVEALIEPMMTMRLDNTARLDLSGAQAILLTSANGARALAAAAPGPEARRLPVLAVGPATAQEARDAGFESVSTAEGDVDALAALAAARLRPDAGRLVHVAGRVSTGDLVPRLSRRRLRGCGASRSTRRSPCARSQPPPAGRWKRRAWPASPYSLPAARTSLLDSCANRGSRRRRVRSPRSA